ncbi:RNA polymerase sigma-70 factor, ECF subfamily [Micromonospora phaseoli]|uniref:RNA polymerase sigma-70 factor, ECF subfamily n=1 Tax=Micromonospora phaseoli TaxID=1144548 RepID=A0A1H7CSG0_9ACTN|nr:RNA polymerase sigma factor SigJ [Micromonospora phaseoli]PZV97746.1 RNA polymerase sigma-70 factor (ECF subfamily) [Micromonospora phaseoli]GIJ78519.1 RNA polymerase sigma24 factor [Micromonospora phaseoli]SEJ89670.1 RNA polymerase sigma-70 factor, ECF subfamily [Micromonospora phaseoli]
MSPVDAAEAAGALDAHRPMLLGLAYRLLGSRYDAEDVLQEAYLRWVRVDRAGVAEPRRYLSRVVTHLSMDRLRARQASRESYVGPWLPEPVPTVPSPFGPLERAELRDSLSTALLHLLERLTPPERAVYVLRTAFELPYAEIAELLDRSAEDCRQLHHRAAVRIGRDQRRFTADRAEQERLLEAFIAAATEGDLAALTDLVAADATAWSDGGGRVRAARNPVTGADRVARFLLGIRDKSGPLTVHRRELNGQPAAVVLSATGFAYAVTLGTSAGRITDIYLVANPEKLSWAA